MNVIKFREPVLILGFILGITGAALAQSPVQFVSSIVKAGQPVPQSCLAEAKVFQTKLALYPQRKGWTNVIVCDELAWQNAMERPGHDFLVEGNYLVDLTAHTFIFDGSDFVTHKVKAVGRSTMVAVIPNSPVPLADSQAGQ
jgi:hypothetical protein